MRTDKMYFVAKDDGSREHFFTTTNSEHVKYKNIAEANRRKRGIDKPVGKAVKPAAPRTGSPPGKRPG
jgi:hypothetical protein